LSSLDANGAARLVRALRRHLGLTQEELARRIGVSFSTVNSWENGKRRPLPFLRRQLEEMARAAGVPLRPDERARRRSTQEVGRR
jgi:transcriptional regulator with XRE-family HTH domain